MEPAREQLLMHERLAVVRVHARTTERIAAYAPTGISATGKASPLRFGPVFLGTTDHGCSCCPGRGTAGIGGSGPTTDYRATEPMPGGVAPTGTRDSA